MASFNNEKVCSSSTIPKQKKKPKRSSFKVPDDFMFHLFEAPVVAYENARKAKEKAEKLRQGQLALIELAKRVVQKKVRDQRNNSSIILTEAQKQLLLTLGPLNEVTQASSSRNAPVPKKPKITLVQYAKQYMEQKFTSKSDPIKGVPTVLPSNQNMMDNKTHKTSSGGYSRKFPVNQKRSESEVNKAPVQGSLQKTSTVFNKPKTNQIPPAHHQSTLKEPQTLPVISDAKNPTSANKPSYDTEDSGNQSRSSSEDEDAHRTKRRKVDLGEYLRRRQMTKKPSSDIPSPF